uniref:Uncharacterized protein n=1 Tax=Anguilla anguilla TaxID=7936 RepID=A0A0E9T3L9_ANGAN
MWAFQICLHVLLCTES